MNGETPRVRVLCTFKCKFLKREQGGCVKCGGSGSPGSSQRKAFRVVTGGREVRGPAKTVLRETTLLGMEMKYSFFPSCFYCQV